MVTLHVLGRNNYIHTLWILFVPKRIIFLIFLFFIVNNLIFNYSYLDRAYSDNSIVKDSDYYSTSAIY
jgi:hypothetical protein